jgi:hypothetical protein
MVYLAQPRCAVLHATVHCAACCVCMHSKLQGCGIVLPPAIAMVCVSSSRHGH